MKERERRYKKFPSTLNEYHFKKTGKKKVGERIKKRTKERESFALKRENEKRMK